MSRKDGLNLGDRVEVNIYGGYKEIGGNLIEISTGDERIIIDIGLNLSNLNSIYSWPTFQVDNPKELFNIGLVSRVEGLFTEWKSKYTPSDPTETNILGAFVSHMHLDHMFLLPQLNRSIPIYMGETGSIIYSEKKRIGRKKRYWVDTAVKIERFRSYRSIKLGDFKVTPIHVDHSIPGAYGFKIETPDGVIGYSGDYRLHGTSLGYEGEESITWDFIASLEDDDVELYITEGTKYEDISLEHERDVEDKVSYLLRGTSGSVLALFSETDIDRMKTFLKAAEKEDWTILVTLRHFLILKALADRDKNLDITIPEDIVKVYMKRKESLLNWERDAIEFLNSKGYELIELPCERGADYLKKKIIIGWDSVKRELIQTGLPSDSIAIFSNSEPINEEGEVELDRLLNWLRIFSIPSYRIHCSGHIYMRDLKNITSHMSPNKLYVIHSEYPEHVLKYLGYG